jgi:hypothetical protein
MLHYCTQLVFMKPYRVDKIFFLIFCFTWMMPIFPKTNNIQQDSRLVLLGGCSKAFINGVYCPMLELYNGKPLFQKEGDKNKWLLFNKNNKWMVTDTSSKDSNDGSGFCISTISGLAHPIEAKAWKIVVDDDWVEQAGMAAVFTVRYTGPH